MSYPGRQRIWLLCAAAVALLMSVLWTVTPLWFDDLWYLLPARDETGSWEPFVATCRDVARHWHFDTGRLANLLSPVMLCLLPRRIFGLLSALAVLATMCLMVAVSGCRKGSLRSYAAIGVVCLGLPWFEFAFSTIYTLNYVWSGALTMYALWAVCLAPEPRQIRALALLNAAAVTAAGWMHEGFSVPMVAGMAAYLWLSGKWRQPRRLWLAACYALGIVAIAVSPALWTREAGMGSQLLRYGMGTQAVIFVGFNFFYVLYSLMLGVAMLRRGTRHTFDREGRAMAAMFWIAGTVASAIFVKYYAGPRLGWFNQLLCGTALLWLCGRLRLRTPRWLRTGAPAAITVLCLTNIGAAIVRQLQLNDERRRVLQLYEASADGCVYIDIMRPQIDLTGFKTTIRQFNEKYPLNDFCNYYGNDSKPLRILPAALRSLGAYADDAAPAPSCKRIALARGCLLTADSTVTRHSLIAVRYATGQWRNSRFRIVDFRDIDGRRIYWIEPYSSLLHGNMPITDAYFPENAS